MALVPSECVSLLQSSFILGATRLITKGCYEHFTYLCFI
jgi:hypothetical protein